MSEEDKKLIKDIQQLLNNTNYCDNLGKGQVSGLIKLIDKLQKELDNSISKDIIKKLIEDKKQIGTYNIEYLKIEDLEELLGVDIE